MPSLALDHGWASVLTAMELGVDDDHYPTPPASEDESYWNGVRTNHTEWEREQWRLQQKHGGSRVPLQRWASIYNEQMSKDDCYGNRVLTEDNYKSWPDLTCPAVRSKRFLLESWKKEFEETLHFYQTFPPLAHVQLVYRSLMSYLMPEKNACGPRTVYSSVDVFMHSITEVEFTEATVWAIHVRCLHAIVLKFDHMFEIVSVEPDTNFTFRCKQTLQQRQMVQHAVDLQCYCHQLVDRYLCQSKRQSCLLSEVIALLDPEKKLGWTGFKAPQDWYYYLRRYPAVEVRRFIANARRAREARQTIWRSSTEMLS